jgi:hypothetical protein
VDTRRRLEDRSSEPSENSALVTFGRLRGQPGLFSFGECCPCAGSFLRCELPESLVETRRFELLTSSLQRRCSTN